LEFVSGNVKSKRKFLSGYKIDELDFTKKAEIDPIGEDGTSKTFRIFRGSSTLECCSDWTKKYRQPIHFHKPQPYKAAAFVLSLLNPNPGAAQIYWENHPEKAMRVMRKHAELYEQYRIFLAQFPIWKNYVKKRDQQLRLWSCLRELRDLSANDIMETVIEILENRK
jgi:hypothetical protein